MARPITIAGAGPAGLAAAIAIAGRGGDAVVYERRKEVGARFHGDFQGIENWTTDGDVLEELGSFGIEADFEYTPVHECVLFDPKGKDLVCRSSRPLWYLVQRGSGPGTLDQALKRQALAAGAEIKFGESIQHLPEGGIVAHGPRRADAIAVGYTFETDMSDGAYAAVSDELAPDGYAYLMICGGRGTLAACMFSDFQDEKVYLERSVDFFRARVGLKWHNESRFGGFGNMQVHPKLQRGRMLFAGEASGLQDFLFGFGMRFAMISGHYAGVALLEGDPDSYSRRYRQRLQSLTKAGGVNRFLYNLAGNGSYGRLIKRIAASDDPRKWAHRHYRRRWWTSLLYPMALAESRFRHRHSPVDHCRDECDCTWCQCTHEPGGRKAANRSIAF